MSESTTSHDASATARSDQLHMVETPRAVVAAHRQVALLKSVSASSCGREGAGSAPVWSARPTQPDGELLSLRRGSCFGWITLDAPIELPRRRARHRARSLRCWAIQFAVRITEVVVERQGVRTHSIREGHGGASWWRPQRLPGGGIPSARKRRRPSIGSMGWASQCACGSLRAVLLFAPSALAAQALRRPVRRKATGPGLRVLESVRLTPQGSNWMSV